MQCKTINSHVKSILSTKILFSKISFFFQNFVLFYLNLFYFILLKKIKNFFCDEQCSFSDSGTILSPKTELGAPGAHPKPRLHAQACVPAQAFYMPQYSRAYCVHTQPSICHNTAKPTVCLLSLLYATIQPSLLCACSAFYMPQYSQAYCMPAQPSICHNTAEPTICLLRLLYACSGRCMPAQAAACLLRLLYAC